MPILTDSGTVIGGAVIFDRSEVLGTGKGDKINLYLDLSGTETVTLSVAVKSEVVSDYHYISYLDSSNIVKKQPVVISGAGKYIVPLVIGKDVEEIMIEETGLSSTLSVNYGYDNFYA